MQRLKHGFVCRQELGASFSQLLLVGFIACFNGLLQFVWDTPPLYFSAPPMFCVPFTSAIPNFPSRCPLACRPCSERATCSWTCLMPAPAGGVSPPCPRRQAPPTGSALRHQHHPGLAAGRRALLHWRLQPSPAGKGGALQLWLLQHHRFQGSSSTSCSSRCQKVLTPLVQRGPPLPLFASAFVGTAAHRLVQERPLLNQVQRLPAAAPRQPPSQLRWPQVGQLPRPLPRRSLSSKCPQAERPGRSWLLQKPLRPPHLRRPQTQRRRRPQSLMEVQQERHPSQLEEVLRSCHLQPRTCHR